MVPGLIPLLTGSGPGRGSEARVERCTSSPPKTQNQMLTESGPQTPDDAQVKAVLDKMAAAGITRPSSVADVRRAYLFYPKLSELRSTFFTLKIGRSRGR